MNKVRITYCGMEGEGRTLTAAKRDATEKIERALSGDWTPEVLTWRGNAILVHREPFGWTSRIIADSDTGVRAGPVYGGHSGGSCRVA